MQGELDEKSNQSKLDLQNKVLLQQNPTPILIITSSVSP